MLWFYETTRRQIVRFKPNAKTVKMYVCGPTPYDRLHVGHARTFIFFDTLARILRRAGFAVNFVINFSDIHDEVLEKARLEGTTPQDVAKRFSDESIREMRSIHIKMPTKFPMVSSCVPTSIQIIQGLLRNGWAYGASRTVYFDTSKSSAVGWLTHVDRDVQSLRRYDLRLGKRDPLDFILWEECEDEPRWKSPFGEGRPGWHLQDVSIAYDAFSGPYDVHGGAVELAHPHHESEEVLGQATTGASPYVQNWVHVGLVTMGGPKMSKSRGNILYLKEAVGKWGADAVRLALLSRPQLDNLEASPELFSNAKAVTDEICRHLLIAKSLPSHESKQFSEVSYEALHSVRTNLPKGVDPDRLLEWVEKLSNSRLGVNFAKPVLEILGLEDCARAVTR